MSNALSKGPEFSNAPAITKPYTNPEHAVLRSNDAQVMSSSPPTNAAVWGMGCSGVVVASAMTSMSRGESCAFSKATRAAFVASVAVDSWSAAMRRSRIPVFSRIHPSSTPKCCSSSALSMTVGGTSDPHPAKRNGVMRFAMVFLYGFVLTRCRGAIASPARLPRWLHRRMPRSVSD